MQVNRCLFQVAVPQQDLDRAQVGAGFEQVRGKTMPQNVRVYFLLKTRAFGGLLACLPRDFCGDGPRGGMPASSWEEPLFRFV